MPRRRSSPGSRSSPARPCMPTIDFTSFGECAPGLPSLSLRPCSYRDSGSGVTWFRPGGVHRPRSTLAFGRACFRPTTSNSPCRYWSSSRRGKSPWRISSNWPGRSPRKSCRHLDILSTLLALPRQRATISTPPISAFTRSPRRRVL